MSGPLRVAVLGAGTVGREVIRGFLEHPERLRPTDGSALTLVAVAVRDTARARARADGIPPGLVGDAPAHLVASPDTDIIVELMGGDEPAHTLVAAALAAGKSVVTANKHLIAHHGPALEAIARRTGASLRFEAAVGGGIPVLGPLATDLAANRVTAVRGIVNGTTNFILTAMADEGRSYDDVLAAAQAAGYAEADPSGDVEGLDAANKLVLLVRLAFGSWIDPDGVPKRSLRADGTLGAPGITGVTAADIAAAAEQGWTIKLLASAAGAARLAAAGPPTAAAAGATPVASASSSPGAVRVTASVVPTAVPSDSPFGRTGGVLNRIEIDAEPIGRVAFSGPGAGGAATSSAVLGDLLAIARELGSTWAGLPPANRAERDDDPSERRSAPGGPWFDAPSGARYPIVE